MKKLVLAVMFVLMSFGYSLAATAVDSSTVLYSKGDDTTTLHVSTNTVEVGTPEIFAIPMKKSANSISEITFESSSTSWTVHLSSIDSQTTPSVYTFLEWGETSKTTGSPELIRPRDFYGGGTPSTNIYATITATTVNSGTWSLKVTERNK